MSTNPNTEANGDALELGPLDPGYFAGQEIYDLFKRLHVLIPALEAGGADVAHIEELKTIGSELADKIWVLSEAHIED